MKLKTILFLFVTLLIVSCSDLVSKPISVEQKDSCCVKDTSQVDMRSEITCPNCGFKKTEEMPTDVCQLKYTCNKCKTDLYPEKGDCCVFCTYGDRKCPSKQ